jgi:hypothetical protein
MKAIGRNVSTYAFLNYMNPDPNQNESEPSARHLLF